MRPLRNSINVTLDGCCDHRAIVPDDLVRSVRAPTLILPGDRDVVKPEHALELARRMPDARLLVLPGGHGDYLGEAVATREASRRPELTAGLIEAFLDQP